MPLVAQGALAYVAGLLVALRAPSLVALTGMALALGVAACGSRARWYGRSSAGALAAAGLLVGLATARDGVRCTRQLAGARQWAASFEHAAQAGDVARATVRDRDCRVAATLLLIAGSVDAGDVATVRGVATSGERGLFVRDAEVSSAKRGPLGVRLRARAGARIDRLFASDAPIVRALVIADMSAIPAEQRDRFARAGLVHMLSVSGLHVAVIALALELLASALRLPMRPARIASLALLAAYVAAIGAPPPAVRAAAMLGVVLASRLIQRPTSPWAVIALGAVLPLADAHTVVDLGWQLSVAGTVALVAGGALAKRSLPDGWGGARRSVARALVVSVVATVVTAPLVAWSFGRIALLGPITNLLADPLMAIVQPLLFAALCIPSAALERGAADAAHLLLAGFDGIATLASSVPGAAPVVLPTVLGACAAGGAAVATVVACVSRRYVRALILALCCVAIMLAEPLLTIERAMTELHVIDVGQGDAIALRTRRNHWVVVDAGPSWPTGDAGRSVVVPYIAHRGGIVSLFVLSHPHADHVGGASSLFAALHPAAFLDPGYVGSTPPYLSALGTARVEHIPWRRVHPGDSLVVDEAVITALAPDSAWASNLADANLASTVLLVRVGRVRMLLTGDAEGPEEGWLLDHWPNALSADVLKVAHHGSTTSTTPEFLAAVRPRLALISVGAHNSYGHPGTGVLDALRAAGAQTLRTDLSGTIIARTDGTRLEVEARSSRWDVPPRSPLP